MAEDLIELMAPGGCDEANHAAQRYRVDNNGRVRVPREAAFWLIRSGGFKVAPADPSLSARFDAGFLTEAVRGTPPEPTTPNDEAGVDQSAPDPRRVPRRSK